MLKSSDANVAKMDLSGPTSFALAIYKANEIVKQSGGPYHILVIIADGRYMYLRVLCSAACCRSGNIRECMPVERFHACIICAA
jgi:hypothetical protein